jgi:hypothetical protein
MSAEVDVPGMGYGRAAYLDTLENIGVLVEIIDAASSAVGATFSVDCGVVAG